MPINAKGMNDDYVSYFDIEEYVDRIVLKPSLLEHLEETNKAFDAYMRYLANYNHDYVVNYWIHSLYKELEYNQNIEMHKFNEATLMNKGLFFDTLNISHKRIHQLHNFVVEGQMEPSFNYRNVPVNVSSLNSDGSEDIFWRGAEEGDVLKFMNDFINLYKQSGASLLFSNPFLVSSLMHLIFLRIHPYTDGNGRTARMIHNLKFTETINKIYGMKLKISPLNLSESILINKITYIKKIDNIYFDVKNDTNDAINDWFNYILFMADEQIFKTSEMLRWMDDRYLIENPYMSLDEVKNGSRGLKKTLELMRRK